MTTSMPLETLKWLAKAQMSEEGYYLYCPICKESGRDEDLEHLPGCLILWAKNQLLHEHE